MTRVSIVLCTVVCGMTLAAPVIYADFVDVTPAVLADPGSGQGTAWIDFDGDGDPDLVWGDDYSGLRLVRNDGGTFVDVTPPVFTCGGRPRAVSWADYDGDGDPDLYLCSLGYPNHLFRNDGGGAFTDVTSGPLGDPGPGRGAAWTDYDRDGRVDLYTTNYGAANHLLHNDGSGSFSDVTPPALVDPSNTHAATWADFDGDGDSDVYVLDDGQPNHLVRNDGGGAFTDVTTGPLGDANAAYSGSWGDYDNDGDLDLYLGNYWPAGGSRLFRNDGGGTFTNVTPAILALEHAISTTWVDYDNDGKLDLYVGRADGMSNRLFRNLGGGTFQDVTAGPLFGAGNANGLSWGDYDGDGDLDLYLSNHNATNQLLRNDSVGNHWLHVKLVGTVSNRWAIGARVEVVARADRPVREINGACGWLSHDQQIAAFGLGASTIVDTVIARWPSGIVDRVFTQSADRTVVLTEGSTTAVGNGPPVLQAALRVEAVNPLKPGAVLRLLNPSAGPVSVHVYDVVGRLRGRLTAAWLSAGEHQLGWSDLVPDRPSSGVFFVHARGQTSEFRLRVIVTR